MELWSRIKSTLQNLSHKPEIESHLDQELRSYVDMVTDERISAGMSASEARRTALAELGGIEQVKQAVREHRAGTGIELFWQDVRYAVRQVRRNRGFTLTAVITLGLGIGATTAIFSAVYSLLLRPLPFPDSHQLVYVSSEMPSGPWGVLSPDFVAAQLGTKSFQQFAGYCNRGLNSNLISGGEPVRVNRINVSANFFPMLGIKPQLGRNFLREEDQLGGPPLILLSDRLWRNGFHADPGIVGKAVSMDGKEQTIIGVLPPHFSFPDLEMEPDVYAPADLAPDTNLTLEQTVQMIHVIARLKPGVSMQQAQAELQAFFLAHARNYHPVIAHALAGRQMIVEPLQRHLTGDDRKPLYILLVCVAAVLLIACANVANLQLARAVSRRHETALRGALGASRLRLIRQFLVESLVLSSLAAALGLALAFVVTSFIRHVGMLDASQMSLQSRAAQLLRLPFGKISTAVSVDGWVVAFTVGLALITTLLFGLAPAIGGTRTDLRDALQAAALRISSGREQRLLRHALLIIEVGLAVVLLSSAGLLVRSFVNVLRYDSGFDPGHMLTGVTELTNQLYWGDAGADRIRNLLDELMPRLQALPGVEAAAVTTALPLQPTESGRTTVIFNPTMASWKEHVPLSFRISVTPDYFRAVSTTIFKGRAFSAGDNKTSPRVAIVNRAFAKRFFAGDALGKRFALWGAAQHPNPFTWITVVGIADDVRHSGLEQEVQPEFFVPMSQFPDIHLNIALRTANDPATLTDALRHAFTAVDREQPIFDIETMDQRVSDAIARRRLIMLLIVCFALLAVVLSAVGVYGVFAYSVNQRRHEMGIRLALGASRKRLLRLVVMQAARLIVLGGLFGAGTALLLSKLLTSLLVGVTPHDATSFWLAWALMTTVALIASTLPAADAARTDLLSVLHSE
jgi:predicted permease